MKSPIPNVLAVLALATSAAASPPHVPETTVDLKDVDLTELSLEELLDIEVTIASRSKQKLSEVPGAVYVITGDEIRRAGHTSIQEALRMVPGFYVSNWTTNLWDVTSRGFGTGTALSNAAFLNQLLVMIDGVTVYTPLYAGVWWSLQDIDLDDVDRIEIIRGPGGILWGSNAVHGVVHVITKSAADTQGAKFSGRIQTDQWHGGARYGGSLGENASYRLYYKGSGYQTHFNPFLGFSQDWDIHSVAGRVDLGGEGERHTTFWARAYQSNLEDIGFDVVALVAIPVQDDKRGYQFYGSTTSADGKGTFTAWASRDLQDLKTEQDVDIITTDVEYKREIDFSETSRLVAGAGYRLVKSDLRGDDPFFLIYDPEEFTNNIFRAFAVQTWMVPSWNASFVVGAQVEHNDFTQFEVQPTLRATWQPGENVGLWASATHSTRTPSLEEEFLAPNSVFLGSREFESEKSNTYELGARTQLGEIAALDVVSFWNELDDLHFQEPDGFGGFFLNNKADGESYGVEVALDMKPTARWHLRSAYSVLNGKHESKLDGSNLGTEEYHPQHQFNVRSYVDLGEHWELDTAAYFVEDLGDAFAIAERWRLDVRLGWNPCDDLSVYVGSQQLNSATESEFDEFDQLRRQFYFGLTWTPRSGDDD